MANPMNQEDRNEVLRLMMLVLNQSGLDEEGFQRLRSRGSELYDLVSSGIRLLSAPTPDYQTVKKILGRDFIPPEVISQKTGLEYQEKQLETFRLSTPSLYVVKWCRDHGFMLVAGPSVSMSLMQIHVLMRNRFKRDESNVFNAPSIYHDLVQTSWLMLRKEPIVGSGQMTAGAQRAVLSEHERFPNAAELAWGIALYRSIRGRCLYRRGYVRTSSESTYMGEVCIGYYLDDDGMRLKEELSASTFDDLLATSCRKT